MILDTNAYSALARGLQSVVEAIQLAAEIKLPLPAVAELKYGFAKGGRREQNELILQKFLAQPQISILSPTLRTAEYYAELQLISVRAGKALSQNDIWIAALAREADGILVTFDQDFAVFIDVFDGKLTILK